MEKILVKAVLGWLAKQKGVKEMTAVFMIVGTLIGLDLIGFAINRKSFANKYEGVSPYGKMVEVSGRKMHVSSMGKGGKRIVMLPGSLMRELSKDCTAVCN